LLSLTEMLFLRELLKQCFNFITKVQKKNSLTILRYIQSGSTKFEF